MVLKTTDASTDPLRTILPTVDNISRQEAHVIFMILPDRPFLEIENRNDCQGLENTYVYF